VRCQFDSIGIGRYFGFSSSRRTVIGSVLTTRHQNHGSNNFFSSLIRSSIVNQLSQFTLINSSLNCPSQKRGVLTQVLCVLVPYCKGVRNVGTISDSSGGLFLKPDSLRDGGKVARSRIQPGALRYCPQPAGRGFPLHGTCRKQLFNSELACLLCATGYGGIREVIGWRDWWGSGQHLALTDCGSRTRRR
jgi:hypothetical protein